LYRIDVWKDHCNRAGRRIKGKTGFHNIVGKKIVLGDSGGNVLLEKAPAYHKRKKRQGKEHQKNQQEVEAKERKKQNWPCLKRDASPDWKEEERKKRYPGGDHEGSGKREITETYFRRPLITGQTVQERSQKKRHIHLTTRWGPRLSAWDPLPGGLILT